MEESNIAKESDITYGRHYTYADYLKFSYDEMVEVIKGRFLKMSPAPSSNHQRISRNLCGYLFTHFKGNKCLILSL